MTRIYKIIEVNIVNFLFGIWAVFFLMSDTRTQISFIDSFFAMTERIKLKYIIALAVCAYYFIVAVNNGFKFFKKEFKCYLLSVAVLAGISLYALIFNSREMNLVDELLYFLVPIVLSFMYINAADGKIENAVDTIFYLMTAAFFLKNLKLFSINNFLSIDIIDSYSPFESELAFIFVLLVVYYVRKGKRIKTFVSFIFCFLSLKRLTLIFAVFSILFFNRINAKSRVKKIYYIAFVVLFMVVPFAFELLCSDAMASWFFKTFGMDWDRFVMGRFRTMNAVYDNYRPGGGLGSVKMLVTEYFREFHGTVGTERIYDLHCDVVKIYLECYAVGFFALLAGYFKSAKGYHSLCLLGYIFTECCFNHMFGSGRALYWVLVFFLIFMFNREVPDSDEEAAESSGMQAECKQNTAASKG